MWAFFTPGPAQALGNLPSQALGLPRAIAKEPFLVWRVGAEQAAGLATQPPQDTDTVVEQATVGGIVDVGLDHGAIRPQLPARGHTLLHGEMHDAIMQAVERGRSNQVLPVAQGTMVRRGMVINAAEPTPFGVADDLVMRRRIAPAHQATHHARAERHLDRRRRPPIPSRLRRREQQVMGDPQHQFGIVEQAIHLDQFRV